MPRYCKLILPDGLVKEDSETCEVDAGLQTWSLRFNRKTQAAAENKMTAREADKISITIMPVLSPSLCRLFGTSTPRGFIVLPLLSVPEYGPSSIILASDEGGGSGKPTNAQFYVRQVIIRDRESRALKLPGYRTYSTL